MNTRVKLGVFALGLALLGWLVTHLALSFHQHPDSTEDLTPAWVQAPPTPLGRPTTVAVPPDQTLVAFLVGTDLYGMAGTTGGSCTATSAGRPVDLGWPVHIDWSLTNVLKEGQETVAVAGWTNRTGSVTMVEINCTTRDSTVSRYVAVPTRTAVIARDPWFQPWLWVGLATAGVALVASGTRWVSPPNR